MKKNDIQFIWGVLTAIPKVYRFSKVELIAMNHPYGDGNRELWYPEITIQHSLGDIEIICWDSTLTLIKSKQDKVIQRFFNNITDAKDLSEYNKD